MKKAIILLLVILILGAFTVVRAQQSNANLEGSIKDEQGATLPGVEITARDTKTGIVRATMSDSGGRFRITALAPSLYEITAKLAGFRAKKIMGFELFVNETKVLNMTLEIATVEEEVTVEAEAPLIENTKAEVSTVVTAREVESLPLLTRQFANLALLAPGTTEMGSYDPTKGRMSHFSAGGFRGRAIYYSIDGADSKDNMVGGPVQLFTTEGVEEFSVATHQFKAEYGRTQGTVVTVLTKSGTNEIHGSLFGYFRDKSLKALDHFQRQLKQETEAEGGTYEKPKFSRQNFGFSIGGPIVKDRTHFFAAFERVREKSFTRVDTFGHWPDYEGEFPYPFWENLATINLTHQINPSHSLKLRYGYQNNQTENEGVGGEYAVSNGYKSENTNHNLLLTHTWIMKSNLLNEARLVYQFFDNSSSPNSTEPTMFFSVGGFGQATNMPQETRQTKYQFRDDLSWHVSKWLGGTHDVKLGVDYYYMPRLDLLYANYQNWCYSHVSGTYGFDAPIRRIQKMTGDPWRFSDNRYHSVGLYLQDDFRISDKLTLNLGLRWDYNTGLEFDQSQLASVQFLANYIPAFKDPGLKHDWNNIAPRLGFAYDLFGDGKTVIRGGFGIFYDQLYAETFMYAAAWLGTNPWRNEFYHSNSSGIKNPDGSFWQPGDPLPENEITPGVVSDVIGPEFQYPYSQHFNIGFSHQLSADFAIDVNYVHTETRGLGKGDEYNRYHPSLDTFTYGDSYGSTIWAPRFVGKGHYDGLYVSLRKRFSEKFELRVNYTLAGGKSTLNYRGTDGWGVTCLVENEPNAAREWGPIDTDERHRLFVSGIAQLPLSFQFAAMFRFNTPRPYNITAGEDLNDDDYNDLPPDISHRMAGRGTDNFYQLDFRLSRFFRITDTMNVELLFELFNAFNTVNFGGYNGDRSTGSDFGVATTVSMPREAQVGLRFRF
jgi:hypothetical protein